MAAAGVELPCFKSQQCYVHVKIPPCTTLGHRADTWNVAKPDFVCTLHCYTRGDTFILRLFEKESNEVFAESFWHPDRPMVSVIDAAHDSSRYFALRIDNIETKSHVFIGIGFHDRDVAGQLKTVLHEHGRYLQRMQKAAKDTLKEQEKEAAAQNSGGSGAPPAADLSIKTSIRVSLPGMKDRKPGDRAVSGSGATLFRVPKLPGPGVGQAPQLAPPPGAPPKRVSGPGAPAADGPSADLNDDDFGEFVG